MTKLPGVSGRECARALGKVGFYLKRQEGSHMILRRDSPFSQVVVPDHRELDRGTLRAIIRQAGLAVDAFTKLLQRFPPVPWDALRPCVVPPVKALPPGLSRLMDRLGSHPCHSRLAPHLGPGYRLRPASWPFPLLPLAGA